MARRVGVSEQVILKRIQNKGEVKEEIKIVEDKKDINREIELEELLVTWMAMNKTKIFDWETSEVMSVWAKKILEQKWEDVLEWKSGKLAAELAENLKINMMKLEESVGDQEGKVEIWNKELVTIKLRRKIEEKREELRKAEK